MDRQVRDLWKEGVIERLTEGVKSIYSMILSGSATELSGVRVRNRASIAVFVEYLSDRERDTFKDTTIRSACGERRTHGAFRRLFTPCSI